MYKLLLLLCVSFVACKTTDIGSGVKDEGNTRIAGRSYEDILAKLNSLYQFNEHEQAQVRTHLINLILSSFMIDCGDGKGTGFFVAPNGKFVTAAHVLNEDALNCTITQVVDAGFGEFNTKVVASNVSIDITVASNDEDDHDVAYGTILSFKNHRFIDYLQDENKYQYPNNRLTLAVGFPTTTFRDGTQSEAEKAEHVKFIQNIACNPKNIEDYLKSSEDGARKAFEAKKPENMTPEIERAYFLELEKVLKPFKQRIEKQKWICEHHLQNWQKLAKSGYDQVLYADQLGMYISVGRTYASDENDVLTNNDTINGYSGSALFDVNAGLAIGVCSGGILNISNGAINPLKNVYFPDSIFSKVSHKKIDRIKKDPLYIRNACLCKLNVFEGDAIGATTTKIFSTNDITCVPDGADPKYFCKTISIGNIAANSLSEKGKHLTATFTDCQEPVQIRTKACTFGPGSVARIYREGKYFGRVTIDAELENFDF